MIARLGLTFCSLFPILILILGFFPLVHGISANNSNNSSVYEYEFSWGFLSVARLAIDFSEIDSDQLITARGETTGFSKILKNYKAEVRIKRDDLESTSYYELLGTDSGVEEIRKIIFRKGKPPKLVEFKDSSVSNGLTDENSRDVGSVDPLSVFSWFFREKFYEKTCDKKFKVFDGKKRFSIVIENIENYNFLSDKAVRGMKCRITMIGDSVRVSEENSKQKERLGFWPFNRKDQTIDVLVRPRKASEEFYVEEIAIYSPVGRIIGRIQK